MEQKLLKVRVRQAAEGDKEALLALVLEQRDEYYRLALAYMKNRHDALDAMEDMIVALYEQMGQLRDPEKFYAWSKTILVNACKRMLRGRAKYSATSEAHDRADGPVIAVQRAPGDEFAAVERRADIDAVLGQLSEPQREAIELKYFHDLEIRTIAQMTNVSPGTVKTRIHYGLKRLKEILGGENDA